MTEEKEDSKKATSRKWVVTIWAMVVGTLIIAFSGVCAVMGKSVPDSFGGLSMLLFSTGIAYIGGNVWQKQIYSKGDDK